MKNLSSFTAGALLALLLLLAALTGCATIGPSSREEVMVEGLGSVMLDLDNPTSSEVVTWGAPSDGIPGPALWLAFRCRCGAVSVALVLPERGGARVLWWTVLAHQKTETWGAEHSFPIQ
jgi:hypothetical protein